MTLRDGGGMNTRNFHRARLRCGHSTESASRGSPESLSASEWRTTAAAPRSDPDPARARHLAFCDYLSGGDIQPDHLVFYVANASKDPVKLVSLRLYLPKDRPRFRVFFPQPEHRDLKPFRPTVSFPLERRGAQMVHLGTLPLTYAVVEAKVSRAGRPPLSLWAKVRIKREAFDISGGWVDEGAAAGGKSAVTHEPFLKLLKREHINTAHLGQVPDTPTRLNRRSVCQVPAQVLW